MLLDHDEPTNYEEAMVSPDSAKWLEAMKSEMTSMHLLHTSKTSTSLLTMKLLLCFSTENPRGLCASFDVSEWQPSCFEHISRSSYESQMSIPDF